MTTNISGIAFNAVQTTVVNRTKKQYNLSKVEIFNKK